MVAAEMAATSPHRVDKLVLIAPIGLWRDDHPVPDISGIPPTSMPGAGVRRPDQPARGVAAVARPDRSRLAVPGLADDGEHPAVHLAAARQGLLEAAVPGEGADAARVGRPGRARAPGLRRRLRGRSSPTPASRSSTAPATSRSSNRPSARSALITAFVGYAIRTARRVDVAAVDRVGHAGLRRRAVVRPRGAAVDRRDGDAHEEVGGRRLDVVDHGQRLVGPFGVEVDERARDAVDDARRRIGRPASRSPSRRARPYTSAGRWPMANGSRNGQRRWPGCSVP